MAEGDSLVEAPSVLDVLTGFALWASDVWDAENADDCAAAQAWAGSYLAGNSREGSFGALPFGGYFGGFPYGAAGEKPR